MNPFAQISAEQRQQIDNFRARYKTGVLTLFFADMVESVRLKNELGDMAGSLQVDLMRETVRRLLRETPESQEIGAAGDSCLVVFTRPSQAVRFALLLHAQFRQTAGPASPPISVRVGIHMGEVFYLTEKLNSADISDILGLQVDLAHRVMALAQGGQTLMTRCIFDNARAMLRGVEIGDLHPLTWINHGPFQLKGYPELLDVCEVGEETLAPLALQPKLHRAERFVPEDAEPVRGWRPAVDQPTPNREWVLERRLGTGGFGEVWRARHKTLKERRVLKFCFRADRIRFLKREAALFRLLKENIGDHPHIVRIYDVFFDEPPYYIVTDYVEGADLAQWFSECGEENLPSLERRLEIVAQMAEALQAAHDAGVIHRDVKPSNILIRTPAAEGGIQAKLCDFGIGQVASPDVLAGHKTFWTSDIVAGTELFSRSGTRIYMAPEVLAGHASSNRSDIYALGVVCYQLSIGDLTQPLPADWRSNVPDRSLADLLAPCFAGDPQGRYPRVDELARRIRALPQRRKARRRTRWAAIVAAGAACCAAAFGIYSLVNNLGGQGKLGQPPTSAQTTPPPAPFKPQWLLEPESAEVRAAVVRLKECAAELSAVQRDHEAREKELEEKYHASAIRDSRRFFERIRDGMSPRGPSLFGASSDFRIASMEVDSSRAELRTFIDRFHQDGRLNFQAAELAGLLVKLSSKFEIAARESAKTSDALAANAADLQKLSQYVKELEPLCREFEQLLQKESAYVNRSRHFGLSSTIHSLANALNAFERKDYYVAGNSFRSATHFPFNRDNSFLDGLHAQRRISFNQAEFTKLLIGLQPLGRYREQDLIPVYVVIKEAKGAFLDIPAASFNDWVISQAHSALQGARLPVKKWPHRQNSRYVVEISYELIQSGRHRGSSRSKDQLVLATSYMVSVTDAATSQALLNEAGRAEHRYDSMDYIGVITIGDESPAFRLFGDLRFGFDKHFSVLPLRP